MKRQSQRALSYVGRYGQVRDLLECQEVWLSVHRRKIGSGWDACLSQLRDNPVAIDPSLERRDVNEPAHGYFWTHGRRTKPVDLCLQQLRISLRHIGSSRKHLVQATDL